LRAVPFCDIHASLKRSKQKMDGEDRKRKMPLSKPCAVIFDMDGVIVDNMDHHAKAWETFLKRHSHNLSIEDVTPHFGKTNKDIMGFIFGRQAASEDVARWSEEKEGLYREIYAQDMAPLPGLLDFLKALRKRGVRTVVATSAPKKNLDFVLDGLKIRSWFDAVVDASEVKKGKPDPEIYLAAARKVGCPAEACVVFEDSLAGIQAGLNAGMKVIGVATTLPEEKLKGTELVIRDFREVTAVRLKRLARKDAKVTP
jgi:beta-phosphoglucomutase